MFTTIVHQKGAAPQLGARQPGEEGPFGRWPDDLEDDGQDGEEHDQNHDDEGEA